MGTIRQALHIFKKDTYHLRHEIAFVLIGAMFAVLHPELWSVLFVVGSWYLIVRAVHSDAIPGNRRFWLTRPYSRTSLVLAKGMFIVLFVNLPLLVMQTAFLSLNGYPAGSNLGALLCNQVALTPTWFLAAWALASVTEGLVQLLGAALGLFALGALQMSWLLRLGPPGHSAVDWIRDLCVFAMAAGLATVVLWLQYSRRRTTIARALVVGGLFVILGVPGRLPWNVLFTIQIALSRPRVDLRNVRVALDRGMDRGLALPRDTGGWLELPVSILGVPGHRHTAIHSVRFTVAGRSFVSNPQGHSGKFSQAYVRAGEETIDIDPMAALQLLQLREPVTIRGSMDLTLTGNPQEYPMPKPGTAIDITGVGRCQFTQPQGAECEFLFRPPWRAMLLPLGNRVYVPSGLSYSPLPAEPSIRPIGTMRFGWPPTFDASTLVTEEPLAHLRKEFEFRAVHLEDFVAPKR